MNSDQHQVHKVTIATVKYVENSVSYFAGLKSCMGKHVHPAAPHHNIRVSQSDQQFSVCGKICCNLEGLKSYLWVHTTE